MKPLLAVILHFLWSTDSLDVWMPCHHQKKKNALLVGDREVRVRIGTRAGQLWYEIHELVKVHGAQNAQLVWKPRHQITTAHLCCHESTCQLWQHTHRLLYNTESRRQIKDERHLQNRSQSHDLVSRRRSTASVAIFPRRSLKGCKSSPLYPSDFHSSTDQ